MQIKLQTDVDQLNANVTTVTDSFEDMRKQLTEKIVEEKDAREEETESLKKQLCLCAYSVLEAGKATLLRH